MRSAWDFGRVQLSLTSASFAFFNTGSFFSSFSSLSLCPLFVPSFPEVAGFLPPDLPALPISLVEQFHGVLRLQIKLDRDFAHPHGENFSTFDLRLRLAIDQGNTGETRGNSVIGHQPSTLTLLFSFLLDIFCVRKYFGEYLCSCWSPQDCARLWRCSSFFEDFNCDFNSELSLKFYVSSEISGHIARNFIVLNTIHSLRLLHRLN